jgi:hypothetical protein
MAPTAADADLPDGRLALVAVAQIMRGQLLADCVVKVFGRHSGRESAERDSYQAPFADYGFLAAPRRGMKFYQSYRLSDY